MSKSTHQLEIKGADKTAGAFSSIKSRAKTTSAQLKSMLGGALAAAGAYLGLRSIKGGIDELGHLSDIAMKTSTSVDELTQTTNALGALGIQNMGVDQLGKAFDYMVKTTGRSGMEGFYKTIEELGKIPDVALRGQEAMRIFGRSGMELMPLINAAGEGTAALKTVKDAMPGISQAAANAGDGASDALGFAEKEVESLWLEGLGFLANKLNNDYTGDVRTAALKAGNYLTYYTKIAVAKCITWFQKMQQSARGIGDVVGAAVGSFSANAKWYDWLKLTNPGTIAADFIIKAITGKETALTKAFDFTKNVAKSALEEYDDVAWELDKIEADRLERFESNYEKRSRAIQHFKDAYEKAAISTTGRKNLDNALSDSFRSPNIRNDLIAAGSNAATRLQILGPTLQSEQKKTNALLEQVVENTKQTADNTEEKSGDDLGTVET